MSRARILLVVMVFVAAVLALSALPAALAQTPAPNLNPCTGLPAAPPYYTELDLAKPWPVCVDPTIPRVDANAAGIMAWRWCKTPSGNYGPQWSVAPWSDFTAQPALALELMAAGLSMNDAAMETITRKYADLIKPLSHPSHTAIWCPLWPKVAATRPAPPASSPPPPSTHIVAKNGTSALRPTYPVVGGRRSTATNGNVPVGSDCDVAKAIVEGPLTFGYPKAAKPDSVALCVKR